MFEPSRSRLSLRWWIAGAILVALALVLLNTAALRPVRNLAVQLTLPAQQVLHSAGTDVRSLFGNLGDTAALRERNAELERLVAELTIENVRLREVEAENAHLRGLLDFAEANPSYDYRGSQIIGRVVSSEPGNMVQSIMIDLGERHGIREGMPVVTELGLVGRVTDAYRSASRVLLITDSNSSVNAILQNGRLRGIVRGRADLNPIMDYLPQDEQVAVGDIVVTSGETGNLPKGVPVGQVIEVQRNDVEMFQRAIVRTTVDFNTLETVLVVTNFEPAQDLKSLPER